MTQQDLATILEMMLCTVMIYVFALAFMVI